ncbi:hypothetical protein Pint_00470 [Pistacia integerrima]|uniref:Uncharacterized protein n=1 Tax=Pistacia integerrima TaxID=434235 RepID=A0ACC0ZJN2_9ROSI|nr:hypothetical protein Pint_00470 [Pistacia integerrima]
MMCTCQFVYALILYAILLKSDPASLLFCGAFELNHFPDDSSTATLLQNSLSNGLASAETSGAFVPDLKVSRRCPIVQLELCFPMRLLLVLYSDGKLMSCSVSKKGLKQPEFIKVEKELGSGDAVCASVASEQQILAVGTRRGIVELYDLAESASLIRTVSLYDWGYSMDDTGSVSCIAWTPDNSAFAVGWKSRGLTPNQDCKYEPLMSGTSLVQWDEYGYKLYAIEEGSLERILAFSFGKFCLSRGVSGMTYVRQVSYISQNWPVQHVAASKDGMYLAVAGLHGLKLYDIRTKKWRVFGDITQEQKIQCEGQDLKNKSVKLKLDPELEFDREVYPLGLLPNAGVVVGVSQRLSFSACTEFPCFEPTPQAQTLLHCLLRHLLQRDKIVEALRLAQLSAEKPQFAHCLEWLLFTVFDAEISRQNINKNQISIPKRSANRSLLEKTCDLIRNFPEYLNVVVSVARKTDGRHWSDLFSAAGRSTEYAPLLVNNCFWFCPHA